MTDGKRGRSQIMEGPVAMPGGGRAPEGYDYVFNAAFP